MRQISRSANGLIGLVLVIFTAIAGAGGWYYPSPPDPLAGFASGNGRLEATEIDIATKLQGRVAEILVDEGDWVKAGQIIAHMDAKTLQAIEAAIAP